MRLLSDHRPWSVGILATAAIGFAAIAVRLTREGDVANAVSFGGGAALFVFYLALIVLFGRRTKRAAPDAPGWTISARRWGGNVEIVSSSDAVGVDLADSQLRAADVSTVIVGRHDTGVLPVLGEEAKLRLLVDASDVDRALEVLSQSGVSFPLTERDQSNSDIVEQGENDEEEN